MALAASTAELSLRMLVSLAVVGLVVLVVLRFSRWRPGSGRTRPGIGVEARCQLTRTSSVAVVRAGQRCFLLGVSDQTVTLLAEGDDLGTGAAGPEPEAPDPEIVDVRAKDRDGTADVGRKGGAGRRHGRAGSSGSPGGGSASPGMSVIEALREKTVRRR